MCHFLDVLVFLLSVRMLDYIWKQAQYVQGNLTEVRD